MSDLVRVSCSGLVYTSVDGLQVGLVSRSKLAKGKWFLTPIGGRHKYTEDAARLFADWDAQPDEKEKSDLVLRMPQERVGRFREWYHAREGREVIPKREIAEELVDVERVFPSRDLAYVLDEGFIFEKYTPRAGVDKGEATQYFFDVYRFTAGGSEAAFRKAVRTNRHVCLVTPEDAIAERMKEGQVGDMFKFFGLSKEALETMVASQQEGMRASVLHLPGVQYTGNHLD